MSIATTFNKAELIGQFAEPYKLPDGAVEFYQKYGYIKLKNVLSREVLSYYGEIYHPKSISLKKAIRLKLAAMWKSAMRVKPYCSRNLKTEDLKCMKLLLN